MKKLSRPIKLWLKALRSRKYKQAVGQLRVKDSFCCLGVACELAVKEGIIKKYTHNNGELPPSVRKWLGLRDSLGGLNNGKNKSLVIMNDRGKSFFEIANLIESQPEGLFL